MKPGTIGLIPTGGYTCNNKYSKKAIMLLLLMEQTDRVVIKHAHNGLEYRQHELPQFSVDGYCAETNTIYEFFVCYWQGCASQPFRDVFTTNGDNLAARYEQTMGRLEQITRAAYQVKVLWECEFYDAGIETPELLAHPTVCHSFLCARDTLYEGRTEAMHLHYKAQEVETIQYVEVMSSSRIYMQVFQVPRGPSNHPCGRRVQRIRSLLAYGRPYNMFYRSTREVVTSRAPLPSQSETHVLSVPNFRPNLQYR